MDTKEKFKLFVKGHPGLLKYIKSGEMTWQKFYEIYDIYGEDDAAWKEYLTIGTATAAAATTAAASTPNTFGDLMSFVKNIDLDSVQNGVSSLQRVLGVLQDFGTTNSSTPKEEYKPRPLYKHFED